MSIWWLLLFDDLADAEQTGVATLSNCGPEVNSSNVLAIVGVSRISWEAVADVDMGIGVVGGAASRFRIAFLSGTKSVIRANSFLGSILYGEVATSSALILLTMDLS